MRRGSRLHDPICPRRYRRLLDIAAALLATSVGFAGFGRAAEYSVEPGLSGRMEYNDNIALRFVPAASWRYTLEPTVTASRRTEASQISARARLSFNRYSNSTVSDATDKAVLLSGRRSFERSTAGLIVDYSEVSSQSLQVLGQTGINLGRRQVDSLIIAPSWTYSVAPRLSLNANASYTGTKFQQTTSAIVPDYETWQASAGVTRNLSERATVGLSLGYTNFDTSPFVSRSETWSANASTTYSFTPTLKGSATLGVQEVVTNQAQVLQVCPVDPILCQLGLVRPVPVGTVGESTRRLVPFNLGLQWQQSERDNFSAEFIQRVNPSGVGTLTASYQVNLNYTRALSPTSDLLVAFSHVRSRFLTPGATATWDLITVAPTVTRRFSEAWSGSAGYSYTRLTYPEQAQTVEANAVFVSATYQWPAWNVSK